MRCCGVDSTRRNELVQEVKELRNSRSIHIHPQQQLPATQVATEYIVTALMKLSTRLSDPAQRHDRLLQTY